MNELKSYIGYLVDGGGNYYHNYREDSYVASENEICPTIKTVYGQNNSFWVLEKEKEDGRKILSVKCYETIHKFVR